MGRNAYKVALHTVNHDCFTDWWGVKSRYADATPRHLSASKKSLSSTLTASWPVCPTTTGWSALRLATRACTVLNCTRCPSVPSTDSSLWAKNYKTWEGSIPFTNQVLNDRLKNGAEPYPNYNHRVWYLDGEWKTESGEITMLSVQDSYTERMYTWLCHPEVKPGLVKEMPCKNHPEGKKSVIFDTPAKAFANERQLLADFAAHMRKQDPDIIAGWYVVDADIYQICTRMRACGLDQIPVPTQPTRVQVQLE